MNLSEKVSFKKYTFLKDKLKRLLNAHIGISLTTNALDKKLNSRSEIYDYIWAKIPVIFTKGDEISELIEDYGLGIAIPPEDNNALINAMLVLIEDNDFYDRCVQNMDKYNKEIIENNYINQFKRLIKMKNFLLNTKELYKVSEKKSPKKETDNIKNIGRFVKKFFFKSK